MKKIVITPEALSTSAKKYRDQLLQMPIYGLEKVLPYMTIRPGIRMAEVVGELSGGIEFGPYDPERVDTADLAIDGRELQTFFGSVVKKFDPNSVYGSIYGAAITKGEALKDVPVTVQILSYMGLQLGKNLAKEIFTAVRNASGTTSHDLFNGFGTITESEITAGNIAAAKGNFISVEAISNINAVDIIKSICAAAKEELTDGANLLVPRSVYNAYCEDYKQTTGSVAYNREFKQTVVEGYEEVVLAPLSALQGSNKLYLTPKQNMLIGMNTPGEETDIAVEKHHAFLLDYVATCFFGVQFESISPERLLVAKMGS